jgi:hypothetical protein
MTINESRASNGTLTLTPAVPGTATDLSCQVTNVRVVTTYTDDGDAVTTLCGETKNKPRKLEGHKLAGTIIQDFDLAEADGGVIDFLWNHSLELVPFEYTPDDLASCPVITGSVTVEIPGDTYGGDVGTRLTSDFEWGIDGAPTRTYPAGAGTARASRAPVGASA